MRQRALLQDHQQLSRVGVVETWDQSPRSDRAGQCVCVKENSIIGKEVVRASEKY